jgi:hypothetical protein
MIWVLKVVWFRRHDLNINNIGASEGALKGITGRIKNLTFYFEK